jgi:hypothetical protein
MKHKISRYPFIGPKNWNYKPQNTNHPSYDDEDEFFEVDYDWDDLL